MTKNIRHDLTREILAVLYNHGIYPEREPREMRSFCEGRLDDFVEAVVGAAEDYGLVGRKSAVGEG